MLSMEFNMDDALRVRYNDGRKKGREEGREEKAERIAEKMLKRGMSVDDVAEDTELSIVHVKEIAEKIKDMLSIDNTL